MAIEYKQTSWETGKVLTAAALNNIEQGLSNITAQLNGMDSQVASNTLNVAGTASIGGDATILGKLILNMEQQTDDNNAATKGYVDGKVTTINGYIANLQSTTITSTNTGITSTGSIGSGLSITLNPATAGALGGIKVGQNLTIDETGLLNAIDTTYSVASASANGLMSSADFNKLAGIASGATANVGTVTGIQMNGTVQEPSSGIVDLGTIITSHQDISTKANLNSPTFSGVVNFGDQISIDTNNNKITINQTDITETQLNALYNLPSIPPLSSDEADGTYTLQAQKTGTDITYSWVLVGGE